ncbi:aromatic acid/H+ symport family MFS transporter [Pseudomonas sp. PNP]|uniref:MFS transporter n=1 Tax=Pseudomonas sp. PNP TaxID=361819 RepID=UPI001AECA95E|nr:aromatic acid/H+ symport family MFS transporter [Pseudomonas sp. PNP]MBP2839311.1 aromatic acid/H+ symport family MFS transporter [Pseudomonas sp. PNP]
MQQPMIPRTRSGLFVAILCFLTIVADGYDLIVYGATVPSLLLEPSWDMTPGTAGLIGGWTLAGLMVGFLWAGWLTDRIGRRKIILIGIFWFSIGSAACAFANSAQMLGFARFLTGIGLGGVIPCTVALTAEYAPRNRRQLYNGFMLTGYSVGGIVSALLALVLLPDHSWRTLYAIGALYIFVLPLMYFYLPESASYLASRGRLEEARAVASQYAIDLDDILKEEAAHKLQQGRGYRLLWNPAFRPATAMFIVVMFCSQLVIYGLNMWLPHLMRESGYPLGSSLQFLLLLQCGAVAGMLGGSTMADKFGAKKVAVPLFLLGAVSLLALSQKLDFAWLTVAVAGSGLGILGAYTLIYGFIAAHFPASCRGAAVGAVLGIGRTGSILGPVLGGWIIGLNMGLQWSFYAFAVPAVIAAVFVALVPKPAQPSC